MSNQSNIRLTEWGSKFVPSYQNLEGQWYFTTIGDTQQVSSAAMTLFDILDEDDLGIRCPDEEEIVSACYKLSSNGIPTFMTDGVLDNDTLWTGGPVTAASLTGALHIVLNGTFEMHNATVLITSTGMVRVAIESTDISKLDFFYRAKLAAGILRALGGSTFSKCEIKSGGRQFWISEEDTRVKVVWAENGYFYIEKKESSLYMRFPLFGNESFRDAVWIGVGGENPHENCFTTQLSPPTFE